MWHVPCKVGWVILSDDKKKIEPLGVIGYKACSQKKIPADDIL